MCDYWLPATLVKWRLSASSSPLPSAHRLHLLFSLQATYQRLQQQQKQQHKSLKHKASSVALETKALLTTYDVTVKTGDVRNAGTDANVYMIMYGENDDSGMM